MTVLVKLKADPTFVAKVGIPAPGGTRTLEVEFKHMRKSQFEAHIKRDPDLTRTDVDEVSSIVAGWKMDEPYSKEALAELFEEYHAAPRAFVDTWLRELSGARVKN